MIVNLSLPPRMNAEIIARMKGTDQLRAVAFIMDSLGRNVVHEDFVMGYGIVCNNVLTTVRERLNNAFAKAIEFEVISCSDVSPQQKQESA